MNLSISGHQLDVTPAIRDYVNAKIGRALRHTDQAIDAQIILSSAKLRHQADVTVHVPGRELHCEAVDENLYAAIDAMADKLDRLLIKHKTKAQGHPAVAIKRQPEFAEASAPVN